MKILDTDILNSKAVKAFTRGLLVIVGLFGGLSYGIVRGDLRNEDRR